MGTSPDFIQYICDQIAGVGDVRYRKMFGEYMVYVNDKPILLVCDNTVYVKKITATDEMMACAEKSVPYQGAKEHHILDIDDAEFCKKVVSVMESYIPFPKPKKKKVKER
jgi:TfoX/Sxy family transcriptional regulator of competence genes